jgi:hypothetical protein
MIDWSLPGDCGEWVVEARLGRINGTLVEINGPGVIPFCAFLALPPMRRIHASTRSRRGGALVSPLFLEVTVGNRVEFGGWR